jgi:hypothetical protein
LHAGASVLDLVDLHAEQTREAIASALDELLDV